MNIINIGNKKVNIKRNTSCYEVLKELHKNDYKDYLAVKVNNTLKELSYDNLSNGDLVEFIDIKNRDGLRIYIRTLSLVFIKACRKLYNNADIIIEHSLNKGLYCEIKVGECLSEKSIINIKDEMQEIIDRQIHIKKFMLNINEAKKIFQSQKMPDKVMLLDYSNTENVRTYELEGYYDTFYGYVAPNTNVLKAFDIKLFGQGVILRFPMLGNNYKLPEYVEDVKISKIFKEAEDWGNIMEVSHVGALNKKIVNNLINDLILVNEALHEKKIAYIADEISANDEIKIVLIAGPSSSGKTTFAQRLSIQLRVNGKKTYAISLDDYFVNRDKTPLDENGNYDFDTIDALDLDLFNDQLLKLMNGEKVQVPTFDFKKGCRVFDKEPIKLTKDHIIVVEGIHGLNDKLTAQIEKENKFKIYISALTQLNIDNHNRVSTSDTRLIRRIVRDNQFRGHNAERTMELWNNVRKGEEKYIFPYQENADTMFNSSLTYELGVLKKYAVKLIEGISENSKFYAEKHRLLKFLSYFNSIDDEKTIPRTSIIKEFLGGGLVE
ncbi:nucleoside kinase [Sedimentibacter sp. zth1]|uniref:nucleoside kinase n=1 Tax=Sedimentibacter sp. zth1 TaxID=2816908 RepID=UPI001A91716F|nr:nucleoside kinase [Sedimentibacter sp. zth1]QSX06370.1 nucleoside kinase [Sedimentibacter sp. zth1]